MAGTHARGGGVPRCILCGYSFMVFESETASPKRKIRDSEDIHVLGGSIYAIHGFLSTIFHGGSTRDGR